MLARADATRAVVQVPGSRPEIIDHAALAARWTGRVLLTTRRARLAGAERRFDITWFIPAIVKYRAIFGQVLLASFVLQLFALASPLIFLVVIDKVLVHQGLTTLDVLVAGLIAVTVFDIVLGWLRTYLFAHTASRVDTELGARLFRHLSALPVAFFEAGRRGRWWRGCGSWRRFASSSPARR